MQRLYTKNATGVAPDGRWYAGDINALQDAVAALSDLTQALGIGTLAVGESGLQLLRFGPGEARVTGALRSDGIFRGLGGLVAGAFTTTQRNAIATGSRPYGLVILNTTTNQLEWNAGTDPTPNWQAIGNTQTSGADVLANRPAATSVIAGSTYFATDQIVTFVAAGGAWVRTGTPAGVTAEWHSSAAAPAGWTAYDGGNLPGSTGIYADIYAHLGNTLTKPDTRGRVSVGQGSNADVAAILQNDTLPVGTRSIKHNMTNGLSVNGAPGVGSLSLPAHGHDQGGGYLLVDVAAGTGNKGVQDGTTHYDYSYRNIGNPTSFPGINGAPDKGSLGVAGTIGPGGTRPTDGAAYTVCLKIAKL